MATDFLTQIVQYKGTDIANARKRVSESSLAELARRRSDFRPFYERLAQPGPEGINIIAEIKRASPSKGDIRPGLDASRTAALYEAGGAAAISVLTDATFFKGSLDDLTSARRACELPVLRKEFIISRYQVYESAAAGADAILLIARILPPEKLRELYLLAWELGMDALVEIHTPDDADLVAGGAFRLVAINNRNLSTFDTDVALARELVGRLGPDQIAVAASGIATPADIQLNRSAGIFNFLVGESIVRAADPAGFIRELLGGDAGQPVPEMAAS